MKINELLNKIDTEKNYDIDFEISLNQMHNNNGDLLPLYTVDRVRGNDTETIYYYPNGSPTALADTGIYTKGGYIGGRDLLNLFHLNNCEGLMLTQQIVDAIA
jgi:hypothetical protein